MSGCFGCDPGNAAGLAMRFFRDDEGRLAAQCTPGPSHAGLGRIVSGGLVATFAEELAAAEAGSHGDAGLVVTRIEVDYARPAYIESPLDGVAVRSGRNGRTVNVDVEVAAGGELVATLCGTFTLVSANSFERLTGITLDEAPECLVAGRRVEIVGKPPARN